MPVGPADDMWIGAQHEPTALLPEEHHNTDTKQKAVVGGHPTITDVVANTQSHELNPVADDEVPTEEELVTLERIADKIPWRVYTVAFVELCERFSYYGTQVLFQNFVARPLLTPTGAAPDPSGSTNNNPGALDQGQRAATAISTFFSFWCYVTPLFGAWIADSYWGRYNTIQGAIAAAVIGHVLLVVSSAPKVLENQNGAFACFVVAMVIFGLGTGGFKPNISPLIAEQVVGDRLKIGHKKDGTRVIVDPTATAARVYLWFYMFINVGALIGQIGMAYAALYVGYWLAFMLPTAMFLLCPIVLILCKKSYKLSPPAGSILGPAMKTLVYCTKGRWSINPVRTIKNMRSADFWETAKPSKIPVERRPAWMTFDDQWVDELRRGFKACTVFLWFPLYWVCYNQINNNLTSMANTMYHEGAPPEISSNIDPLAIMFLVPFFDFIVYPGLRKMGWNFTPIKRIFAGFMVASAAMVAACVMQYWIYTHNECGFYPNEGLPDGSDCPPAPISIWAQTIIYFLIALSEIFASVTSIEYAFTKAPKNMRSMVQAVSLFTTAVANAINEAFVVLSEDPLLTWNYGVFAVITFVAGIAFWFTHRELDAEEDALNSLTAGHVGKKDEVEAFRRRSSTVVESGEGSPHRYNQDTKAANESEWSKH